MIFIINGAPRSGKNTFTSFVRKNMIDDYFMETSLADKVKEIATELGWNGEKTPKDRKFLSDLKDLLEEWNDIPRESVVMKVQNFLSFFNVYDINTSKTAIFIHAREPVDIDYFKEVFPNSMTILMRRTEVEDFTPSNHADGNILNYNYDIEIFNNGTLEDLEENAIMFIEKTNLKRKIYERKRI